MRTRFKYQGTLLCRCLVVFAFCYATQYAAPTRAQEAEDSEEPSPWRDAFSGELELGLNLARSDVEGDVELDQLLRLDLDPPGHERLHVHATLWTLQDLDGDERPSSPLRTLKDASSSDVEARLLNLYVSVDDLIGDSTLRLGRQSVVEGVVYNRIDGLFYTWRNPVWSWYGFAGARASVYEDAHEDLATGAGISRLLPTRTRVSLDVFYGDDERRRFTTDDIETSVTSLTIRQVLTDHHTLFGRASWHEKDLDEIRLSAQGFSSNANVVYTVSYRQRFDTLTERVTDVTQFYGVLGELNEFEDAMAVVDIMLTEKFGLGIEAQVHDAESDAPDSGNRDFQRYGLSFDAYELGGKFDASVLLNYWSADHGEEQWTVTGELSREWERFKGAIGVDYDRYEDRVTNFDPNSQSTFTIETHENIWSLYFRYEREINDRHSLRARASFEDDEGPDSPYWYLRAQYTLRF